MFFRFVLLTFAFFCVLPVASGAACDLIINDAAPSRDVAFIENSVGNYTIDIQSGGQRTAYPYYLGSREYGVLNVDSAQAIFNEQEIIDFIDNVGNAQGPYIIAGGRLFTINKGVFLDAAQTYRLCLENGEEPVAKDQVNINVPVNEISDIKKLEIAGPASLSQEQVIRSSVADIMADTPLVTNSGMIEKMNILERENRALRAKLSSCMIAE